MYSVALKQKQYATYILSDQSSGARLEVVPERGGIITQWDVDDTHILYMDTERFKDPSKSVRGGIPILFPICGNLPDDTYQVDGKSYQLVQHGFARVLPWMVSDRGVKSDAVADEAGAFLQLTLTSNDQTRRVYPFDFEAQFTYRLKGRSLYIEQRFTNKSESPMPFSTGLHPYFNVSSSAADKSQLQLTIPATQYADNMTKTEQSFDGDFDWSVPEIDAAFRPVSAQQAAVKDPVRGVDISLRYDESFTTVVFWTVAGKGFYCLEPWSAPRNALNTGTDLLMLAPKETKTLMVTLSATTKTA
ncbi:MAG: aldose epimerase [Phormidesmis sp.]